MTWEEDKRWADRFMHEIKAILGVHLFGEPPTEEDRLRNTDLITLSMNPFRVAARIRSQYYLSRYGGEFTIRFSRKYGNKTELAKIVEGWGDYLFYGFGSDEGRLLAWHLCDLKVFRRWYSERLYQGEHPGMEKSNGDGSSSFLAFRIDELPAEFILAQSKSGSFSSR